jgi:prepilin-type N-terminal cleavage/methylation domain-containing protein
MKNNRKGFTLVELLAVIVILSIILAIAIPTISAVTTAARTNSFTSTVKMVIKGIEYKILENDGSTSFITPSDTTDLTTSIDDYGGTVADYELFHITSVSPITIDLTGKDGGKFDGCTTTGATFSTLTVSGCK